MRRRGPRRPGRAPHRDRRHADRRRKGLHHRDEPPEGRRSSGQHRTEPHPANRDQPGTRRSGEAAHHSCGRKGPRQAPTLVAIPLPEQRSARVRAACGGGRPKPGHPTRRCPGLGQPQPARYATQRAGSLADRSATRPRTTSSFEAPMKRPRPMPPRPPCRRPGSSAGRPSPRDALADRSGRPRSPLAARHRQQSRHPLRSTCDGGQHCGGHRTPHCA